MTLGSLPESQEKRQFRSFWKSFDESLKLMASGEVVISPCGSPAITAVKSRGSNVSISCWKKVTGLGRRVSACPNPSPG